MMYVKGSVGFLSPLKLPSSLGMIPSILYNLRTILECLLKNPNRKNEMTNPIPPPPEAPPCCLTVMEDPSMTPSVYVAPFVQPEPTTGDKGRLDAALDTPPTTTIPENIAHVRSTRGRRSGRERYLGRRGTGGSAAENG